MSWRPSSILSTVSIGISLVLASGCSCNDYDLTPFKGYEELQNDHGQWLSMGISPDNRLAVAYFDRTFGALGFALGEPQDDGTVGWVHEQVDGYPDDNGLNPGIVGEFCSLAVAANGVVWISYAAQSNGALKVAKRERETWTTELVDVGSGLTPKTGHWSSIAINAEGQPVIAYHDTVGSNLKVATRAEDGTWSSVIAHEGQDWTGTDGNGDEVTRSAKVGEFARLMINGNTQYIAFYDAAQQSLNLLEGPDSAWVHSVVDASANVGAWPSLSLSGENLTVAYQDLDNQDLVVSSRVGASGFTRTIVDDGEYIGADTEVFLKDGELNVVYFDGKTNDMKLASLEEGSWSAQTIAGEDHAVGFHNEVVQDLNGNWWAASYDYTNRKIFTRWLVD